jgi:two-component system sensor histidine kinase VanS
LKNKIYLKIGLVVVSSALFISLLRLIMRGKVANWIVAFLQSRFKLEYWDAQRIYKALIRQNLDFIIITAIAICAIILSVIIILHARKQRIKAEKIAEQRRNELITYLAHDIRTPLTSVIGYLSLLNESADMSNEEKTKHISIALDKAYRLENLVNQFFEISQYNLQTITLAKKDIDLYYMLAQLTDEAYPQLAACGKEAVIQAAENLTIHGDPDKLARAFNNILKNAIAYGDDNSTIEITASIKNDAARIEFKNAGSIPSDKLRTIFAKFYRLDEARSSDTGGTGLGLAIAKEIITRHGGEIWAQSENSYTVLTVRLPVNNIKKT